MEAAVFRVFFLVALAFTTEGAVLKRQALLREIKTTVNCPSGWDPSPCFCRDGPTEDKASVFCDNATSGDEIKEAFSRLNSSHHFGNFFMADAPVVSLPAGVFGKGSFEFFFISNTKLQTLDDKTFEGSEETARNFLLQNNNFTTFNFKALEPLKKMENFELSTDKLSDIPDNAFADKPNLEVIDLNNNEISELGKNAFSKLPKLRKLDLSNNNLTELKEFSMHFSPEMGPISFLISHNRIQTIDKNAFANVKVRLVEIEDNKLEAMDEEIFSKMIESLSNSHGTIATLGNPFSCEPSTTSWLLQLPVDKRSLIIGYMCRDGRALQQLKLD